MRTIIVPVDFSQVSYNAADFAAEMYYHRPDVQVLLYHHVEHAGEEAAANNLLSSLKDQLTSKLFNIDYLVQSGSNFIDSLASYAKQQGAYMIIMGLTGKTPREQRFSGSNTLRITEKNICPVLVIPPDARFKKINNVLIASEMKSVDESSALRTVKIILDEFRPNVHILNVDPSHYISLTEEFKRERDKMEAHLSEFNPQFYFMRLFDFHDSVNMFAKDKEVDMIIIAPKHHSFFEKLFKTQHTKSLIYQSEIPVLTIQD